MPCGSLYAIVAVFQPTFVFIGPSFAGARAGIACPREDSLSMRELLGKTLGDFKILRELGRGGMGIVYETRQLSLNRVR